MDVEGVYRKSGGSGQVKIIQQGFEKDGAYDISDEDLDIHAVTSTLKQYFRKLPNPLITYEAYDSLLEAGQVVDKEKQGAAMKAALDNLPQSHRDVLEYLILHLCRVVKQESENLVRILALKFRCKQIKWLTSMCVDDSTQPFGRFRTNDHAPPFYRARNVGYAGSADGSAGAA